MATVECRCNDSIEITGSNSKVYLTPTYSSGVGEVLILTQAQAKELQAEITKAMAELRPQAELKEPEAFELEDFEGDTIKVEAESRSGDAVVEVGIIEAGNKDETYAVWLTEAQTEELIAALEAHKKYVAQENAKPKTVSSTVLSSPMPLGYGAIDWGVVSRGTIEIPNPADKKPEPKAQTFTITINVKE